MIYLVGGAPRTGKSLLSHRLAAAQRMGWIGTDLLFELLRVANDPGVPMEWNAAPDAIRGTAEWFKPYLDRFLWGLRSQADSYLIEGVGFLPEHVVAYARRFRSGPSSCGVFDHDVGEVQRLSRVGRRDTGSCRRRFGAGLLRTFQRGALTWSANVSSGMCPTLIWREISRKGSARLHGC